jgi:DNA invertase Pin-like site-specific DNA recombinase
MTDQHPTKRRTGISYARFSDPKQAQGSSEERQERDYRAFCQHHNLTPLTEVFLDRGRSGYKDQHRKKGRLGALIRYAKEGRFEPGSVIVIEAWDRLGRLRPDKQTELVAELLRTGVDIGVCQLNDIFTEADFGTHKWIVLSTFIMLAYQESKQKGDRVAASWVSRRQKARENGKLVTSRLPFWLEPAADGARPVPKRVAAVRRVFALAADGRGRGLIVKALVAEGVPAFGSTGNWTRSYVNKLLTDRRVLGEYQPRKTDDTPDGDPIADYYPRIIGDDAWDVARAGQEKRRGTDRRGRPLVRTERKHVNLFRGLLRNALDGEGFFLHQKVESGKRRLTLANFAGPAGRGRTISIDYLVFEQAVLSLLREVDPKEILPPADPGPSRLDGLRKQLADIRHDLAAIKDDLRGGYSKHLTALLREKEAEEEQVAGELQEERVRALRPAEKAWHDLPGLAEMVKEGGDKARLRLRPVLRRVVDNIWVLIVHRGARSLVAVQVFFDGGSVRHYLIYRQAAGRNRKGGWWVESFKDSGRPELDLRRREDAAKLERDLLAVSLDDLTGPDLASGEKPAKM